MKTIVAALFAFGLVLQAASPVPRQAKELKLADPNGTETLLSSHKGEVVVIQFLYTWCEHCQNTARMLSNIQRDFGGQGVQVLGMAFNDEVNTPDKSRNALETSTFARNFTNFPVSLASRNTVLGYLGISVMERYAVPQIIVIDKNGVVRAQTDPMPDGKLQNEPYLREFITKLLNED